MSEYFRVEQSLEAGEKYHLADHPAEERDDDVEEGEEKNGLLSTLWSRRERGLLSTKSLWCRNNWKWILLHLFLLSLWATIYTTTLFMSISNRMPSLVSSQYISLQTFDSLKPLLRVLPGSLTKLAMKGPLQATIEYEKRRFELLAIYRHDGDLNPHKTNSFNGPPRPELEKAWDELTQYRNVRVSLEELGDVEDEESLVNLTDGSGYYVTLSAFHGFHCIRRLHQYLYAEHYYPGLSEFEKFMLLRHTGE
ncbi:hypothetical protein N7513_002014 [Penicillium frequentans]|nr:hypothetical protein N7513_002014 [Penicillium glabrum]